MVKVRKDLTGMKFGRLTVLKQAEDHISKNGQHSAAWWVQCDCGSPPKVLVGGDLTKKTGTRSCGCIRKERPNNRAKVRENLIGQKFGKLTVIDRADDYIRKDNKREVQWLCKCECGNTCVVRGYALKRGTTTSCGCYSLELKFTRSCKQNAYDLTSKEFGIGYTSKGEEFWFDKEDYDLIKDFCWHYGTGGYLVATPKKSDSKRNNIQFHRLVMGVLDKDWNDVIVDHVKHGTMSELKYDNRKQNLRLATRSENNRNAHTRKDNTSGVKGVMFNPKTGTWTASIYVDKESIWLGTFDDFECAVNARKEAQKQYHGEYDFDISQK